MMCTNLLLLHSHSLDESISIIILLLKLHLLSSQFLFEIIHLWMGEGCGVWGVIESVNHICDDMSMSGIVCAPIKHVTAPTTTDIAHEY